MSNSSALDNLFQLVHSLKRQMHEQIELLNLPITPMHVRVIKIIAKKSPCTAMDVVHFINRDKAQVTRLIKSLIEEGFVEKVPNPEDKRSQCLLTTDKGKAVLEQLHEVDNLITGKITQGLSSQDLEDFQRIASKMTMNITKK
ncbi:MarR family transcriptional regulator [Photobacterium jeanii]|uniref:MarR family transcriptional regulator n=1 Tax=Photobacterium jeanii TaxID=858640 RepID=A0A178KKP1_9GAMM|nr:MarR family transcriptional regulator [Photobacterium jeanii]OAN17889.1 MarR family transcriptional regulator [Photobacterium jeanii]PST92444.1 MarR family transcriptional regulator [Photobacterium jeanii]